MSWTEQTDSLSNDPLSLHIWKPTTFIMTNEKGMASPQTVSRSTQAGSSAHFYPPTVSCILFAYSKPPRRDRCEIAGKMSFQALWGEHMVVNIAAHKQNWKDAKWLLRRTCSGVVVSNWVLEMHTMIFTPFSFSLVYLGVSTSKLTSN